VTDQPAGGPLDQPAPFESQRRTNGRRDRAGEAVDCRPRLAHVEQLPGDLVGADDVGDCGTGLVGQAIADRRATAIDKVIRRDRGDELFAQCVRGDVGRVLLS